MQPPLDTCGMATRSAQPPGRPKTAVRAIHTSNEPHESTGFPDNLALDLRARFRTSLRLLASTVALVTVSHGTKRGGLTATAACSLSVDPPLMLVCISRRSRTHGYVRASERFCINYLGEHHRDLAVLFATQVQDGEVKFGSGEWGIGAFGNPVLLDSLATIECRVHRRIDEGTHSVFIGTVLDVMTRNECDPLLYVQGGFAKPAPA
jgi:flavin reductase (DIM6/NTAB) family NADH-FMN oxidoreductase RutF